VEAYTELAAQTPSVEAAHDKEWVRVGVGAVPMGLVVNEVLELIWMGLGVVVMA